MFSKALWLALALLGLALTSCQRNLSPEKQAQQDQQPKIEHPWDYADWVNPAQEQWQNLTANQSDQVEVSTLRGPSFSDTDTLDPAEISGNWLLVAANSANGASLVPPSNMDLLSLRDDGGLMMQDYRDGELFAVHEGNWQKGGAGRLSLQVGKGPAEEHAAEMHGADFLFVYISDSSIGQWFVRLPEQATPQIAHNRFQTTRGDLLLTPVQNSWDGTVAGEYGEIAISGFYSSGLLTSRFEDPNGARGFAVFRVAEDWSGFEGVWWLADFEAAPFGQAWDGTAIQ